MPETIGRGILVMVKAASGEARHKGCDGPPDGSASPLVRIELVRQDTETWKLKMRGERPGGPTPEVWLFDGTVQAGGGDEWVIHNMWPADACREDIPQETHIAYGGSASGQRL